MSASPDQMTNVGYVTLRYWASARAAAGTDSDALEVSGPVALAELVRRAREAHGGLAALRRRCSPAAR